MDNVEKNKIYTCGEHIHLNKETFVSNETELTKCGWTPFNGDKFKGTPTHTIIAGNIKMQDGKILGDPEGKPLVF